MGRSVTEMSSDEIRKSKMFAFVDHQNGTVSVWIPGDKESILKTFTSEQYDVFVCCLMRMSPALSLLIPAEEEIISDGSISSGIHPDGVPGTRVEIPNLGEMMSVRSASLPESEHDKQG
jgi:hypothetical protein